MSLLSFTAGAHGAIVSIPLQLGTGFLKHQAIKQVFTGPDQSFVAWNDGSGCNHLVLSDPQTTPSTSGIRIRMKGEGRVGSPLGEMCVPLFPWKGNIDVLLQPVVAGNAVRLKVIDSDITNLEGASNISGTIWDWTKQSVHPQLANINIDLTERMEEIRAIALLLFPGAHVERVRQMLETLRVAEVSTNTEGLSMTLAFSVPEVAGRPGPSPEPVLSPAESAKLNQLLDLWDVFVTLTARQAAIATDNAEVRDQLLAVLLDARHEIAGALTDDNERAQDPVRRLFLDTWSRLSPLLRRISLGMPGESALDFAGFIGAVDALQAIDAVGPAFNVDISADGLRRLARLITPVEVVDPLKYDDQVDPELRRLFDFGPAPEVPAAEPQVPEPRSSNWFINSAWAQQSWDRGTLFKLNQWIPTQENIRSYLMRVRWLLEDTAFKVLRDKPLPASFEGIFQPLMLAAAWQETCWRQFIERDGKRQPLRSSAGAVGIMQVSPRVWRGFYQPNALAWNINYNAIAGGEILHHYLTHYAIPRGEHKKTHDLNSLARATYAAYNGGPSQLTRYRSPNAAPRVKRIDEGFWEKYGLIRSGDSLAVLQCYGQPTS